MIQFTTICNSTGVAAKRYWIDPETGELKHSSAASIYEGTAQVSEAKDLEDFIAGRGKADQHTAFAYGVPYGAEVGETKHLVTEAALQFERGAIARTRKHFHFRAGKPGVFFIDLDRKPDAPAKDWPEIDGAISKVIPVWSATARVWLPSSSAHIHHGEQELIGLGGWRCYCIVADASAIPDLTDYLYQGLWTEGYGFVHVGGRGQRLGRCLIDRAVGQPERLDFVATPVLGEGLTRLKVEPVFRPGADVLDWQPKDFIDQKTWERENETYRAAWSAVEPEAKRKARTAALELTQCGSTKRAQAVMWRAVSRYELSGDFEVEMGSGKKNDRCGFTGGRDRKFPPHRNARSAQPVLSR